MKRRSTAREIFEGYDDREREVDTCEGGYRKKTEKKKKKRGKEEKKEKEEVGLERARRRIDRANINAEELIIRGKEEK